MTTVFVCLTALVCGVFLEGESILDTCHRFYCTLHIVYVVDISPFQPFFFFYITEKGEKSKQVVFGHHHYGKTHCLHKIRILI